jgi:hypothetical protein
MEAMSLRSGDDVGEGRAMAGGLEGVGGDEGFDGELIYLRTLVWLAKNRRVSDCDKVNEQRVCCYVTKGNGHQHHTGEHREEMPWNRDGKVPLLINSVIKNTESPEDMIAIRRVIDMIQTTFGCGIAAGRGPPAAVGQSLRCYDMAL